MHVGLGTETLNQLMKNELKLYNVQLYVNQS
jgi:hypothetical protein